MTTAQYQVPNFGVDNAATYKAKIDGNFEVARRGAAAFQAYANSTPNMTVKVAAGAILGALGTAPTEVAIQTSGTITAPVVNPRIDRVVIDAVTGVMSIVTGTPAGSPVAPAVPAGKVSVAKIALATSTTAITNSLITDERAGFVPPASQPGLVLLSTQAASASATIDVAIPAGYDEYELHIINARPATSGAVAQLRVSTDGGATFKAGAVDYDNAQAVVYSDSTVSPDNSSLGTDAITIVDPQGVNNGTGDKVSGKIHLITPASTAGRQHLQYEAGYDRATGGYIVRTNGTGRCLFAAAAYDYIRFMFDSGNVSSGTFRLYGINL